MRPGTHSPFVRRYTAIQKRDGQKTVPLLCAASERKHRLFHEITQLFRFVDFSGMGTDSLNELGHRIVRTVEQYTGIPVSLGIAPTKTLAKIANKLCKKYPKLGGCCFMHRSQNSD